jgi:hypothetical protein
MKSHVSILSVLILLLAGTEMFAQSGESVFKKVSISAKEKSITDVAPSFRLGRLSFTDQNNNLQLDGKEEGKIRLTIINSGLNEIKDLAVSLSEKNKIEGIHFENTFKVKEIKAGDSALVTVPLSADDNLKDGSALFTVNVTDPTGSVSKSAEINVPARGSFSLPAFTWIVPTSELEKTDFPVVEIAARLTSATKISSLKIYINGMIPSDRNNFTVLPSEDPREYFLRRTVTLEEGYNEIKLEAQNSTGTSLSDIRVINYSVTKIDQTYREKRLALVIGNAAYAYGNTLANPVNDAEAFTAALKEVGFTVLTYLDADQKAMKRAMDEFGEMLRDYNVGLFYYAGHGLQVKGENYLIPVDASLKIEQDVDYDCIDVGRLLGKMEAAETSTNIIILDACRDNPFERSWSGRSGSRGGGLAFMNAPSGSIIAYATSPGKTASDGTGKNGLYTEALLQYINIPGLQIEEFFKNVRTLVEIRSNKEQTPWESTSLKGNFYFRIK